MALMVIHHNWNVDTIVRREGKIDPRPPYQRGPVWGLEKKQLLIDTILRKYDIPKFYLRKLDATGAKYEHEVADGQQRLRAIWEFVAGKFPLGEPSRDVPGFGDLSGNLYADLPSDLKDATGLYQLAIAEVHNANDLEIRDLFLRLQEGVTLNPAEKRNAMPGSMRDFIADIAETHRVFPLTQLNHRRFGWHDIAAHAACIELAKGPTELKAANLKKMYEDNQHIDPNGPISNGIKRTLNFMARICIDSPPEMDIKWGFVDLYTALSRLDREYVLKDRETDFLNFYTSFEQARRQVSDPADLLGSEHDEWDRDLFDYIESFTREGGSKNNVQKRHEIYIRRILRDLSSLEPKDPKRDFERDERVVMWRRDQGRCQECGSVVAFDAMHADHIVPHTKGGTTTIANGRTLCQPCNQKKGAA